MSLIPWTSLMEDRISQGGSDRHLGPRWRSLAHSCVAEFQLFRMKVEQYHTNPFVHIVDPPFLPASLFLWSLILPLALMSWKCMTNIWLNLQF